MLHEQIKGQIKDAMKNKDEVRLSVIRGIVAAFTNELVAKKRKPDEMLEDAEALVVIKKLVNQRKDSIEQFTTGGRQDLVDKEKAELDILNAFLPAQMSREEIKKIAEAKKAELGITDKAKLGQFIGAVMKEIAGRADGGEVKSVVEELFS